ncbi:MAG: tetratricopeptide repeat protein [Bdellovibrionales bacterium]
MHRLLLVSLFILSACSSGQKASTSGASSPSGPVLLSDDEMGGSTSDPGEIRATNIEIKSDSAYDAFAKAIRSGNDSAVSQEASKILAMQPTNLKVLNGLAMFYYSSGRPQLAKIPLAKAIRAHPNSATLANNLGLILLSEDKVREASTEFRRALTLDESHAEANYHLGVIYMKSKNYVSALPLLKKAFASLHRKEVAGPHYAEALRLAGRLNEAEDVYEEFKAENSNSPAVLLNYASLLIDQLKSKKQGLKIINKIRFLTQDADILKKVDDLSNRAEAIK